ncbi:hypothetical protein QBC35DRAFT_475477 [Podospora australis]|uniref:Uncharacterized protein n=1 Tax=Podospora australis TaxID=1536484 RepID=A0AAN6WQX0_9PEZI|nr:hypothetical protein QBC35DRAFT_475477 [Podospora australis]
MKHSTALIAVVGLACAVTATPKRKSYFDTGRDAYETGTRVVDGIDSIREGGGSGFLGGFGWKRSVVVSNSKDQSESDDKDSLLDKLEALEDKKEDDLLEKLENSESDTEKTDDLVDAIEEATASSAKETEKVVDKLEESLEKELEKVTDMVEKVAEKKPVASPAEDLKFEEMFEQILKALHTCTSGSAAGSESAHGSSSSSASSKSSALKSVSPAVKLALREPFGVETAILGRDVAKQLEVVPVPTSGASSNPRFGTVLYIVAGAAVAGLTL